MVSPVIAVCLVKVARNVKYDWQQLRLCRSVTSHPRVAATVINSAQDWSDP